MKRFRRRDAQSLVDGTYSGADYDAVAGFLDGLRNDAVALPAPAPRPRLAATLDGRRPLRTASDPIPAPTRAPFPARLRALRPATIAIAAGAVFFGGLATAGALPGPLQHASANLTKHVGVHLPGAAPASPSHHSNGTGSSQANAPTSPATAKPATAKTGTTTTTQPRTRSTPSTAPVVTPATGKGTTPVTVPVSVPGTVTVTVPQPGDKPPIVVTLPSSPLLPIELPPVTLPTLPRHHDK